MAQSFTKLPESEKEICRRFKLAREEIGVTQDRIALHIGLTRNQVANIEAERVALRFLPGWQFCIELDINAGWLARGEMGGPLRPFVDFFRVYTHNTVTAEDLFSTIFEQIAGNYYQLFREQGLQKRKGANLLSSVRRPVYSGTASYKAAVERLIDNWLSELSPDQRDSFIAYLCSAARAFRKQRHIPEHEVRRRATQDKLRRKRLS
jgi:DNA-binding XRE family transcriptional regulator